MMAIFLRLIGKGPKQQLPVTPPREKNKVRLRQQQIAAALKTLQSEVEQFDQG